MEQEKKRKAKEAMEAAKALEEMTVKPGDETKTKEQLKREGKQRKASEGRVVRGACEV